MVNVILFQNDQSKFIGYEAYGHAGYAEAGQDIVCAGISAVVTTTAIGIMERLKLPIDFSMQDGDMTLHLLEANDDADLLIDTMRLGLESIAEEYPDFIQITYGGL